MVSKFNPQVFRNATAQLIKNVQNSLEECAQMTIEEVDNNFKNKSFFGDPWKPNTTNSPTLVDTGKLRLSIRVLARRSYMRRVGSTEPYASTHNFGKTYTPSISQQNFFWGKYKTTGQDIYRRCALHLKNNGSIVIPQRQFIGNHPVLTYKMKMIIYKNLRKHYG
jgi:phage gpG-like protein